MKPLNPVVFCRKLNQLHELFGHQGWWPRLVRSPGSIVVRHHPGVKRHWLLKGRKLEIWEVTLGAILTQNTAWSNVEKALTSLAQAGVLTPRQVLDCPTRKLESLIKSAGYYKQKAKKLKIAARWFGVKSPLVSSKGGSASGGKGGGGGLSLRQQLLNLWGIGPETADTILVYGFGLPVFVVDAYTRRLLAELSHDQSWLKKSYNDVREFCQKSLSDMPEMGRGRVAGWQEAHALIVAWGKRNNGRGK